MTPPLAAHPLGPFGAYTSFPLELAVAAIGLSHLVVSRYRLPSALRKATASAYLFVIGNVGTFLGFADCLRNRSGTRWNPVKADG